MEHATRSVIEQIQALRDYRRMLSRHPGQGQFVMTGIQMGGHLERLVGFCVQVRKGRGQCGSDLVFLRHSDGSLVTHENQCYFALTEEQEVLARSIFTVVHEQEDYGHGYRCCDKVLEKGFLIENSASCPSPVLPSDHD